MSHIRHSRHTGHHPAKPQVKALRADFAGALPALASLGLAAVMFFLPNFSAIDDSKDARLEFTRALGAYIHFVALEHQPRGLVA